MEKHVDQFWMESIERIIFYECFHTVLTTKWPPTPPSLIRCRRKTIGVLGPIWDVLCQNFREIRKEMRPVGIEQENLCANQTNQHNLSYDNKTSWWKHSESDTCLWLRNHTMRCIVFWTLKMQLYTALLVTLISNYLRWHLLIVSTKMQY